MNADRNYSRNSPEAVAARAKRDEDERKYQAELAKQKAAGVPQWMDAFNAFKKNDPTFMKQQQAAGYYDIDRPWNSDDGTKALKTTLDGQYQQLLDAYNAKNNTKYTADARQIGVNSQPNDWDHKKNSNSGFLSDTISHWGKVVAENPMAQTIISMAAAAYGVPPNVTMAFLSANNIGQGQSIESVVKNVALQYAGGKLGDMAGGYAKGALEGSGLSAGAVKGLTNAASGAASGAFGAGASGGNLLAGALRGGAGGAAGAAGSEVADLTGSQFAGDLAKAGANAALSGKGVNVNTLANAGLNALGRTDAYKDTANDISQYFKDQGLDGIDISGFNIPGTNKPIIPGVSATDNIVSGISGSDVKKLVGQTPGGKQVTNLLNTLKDPGKVLVDKLLSPNDAGKQQTQQGGQGNMLALLALLQNPNTPAAEKEDALAKVEQDPYALDFLTRTADANPSALQRILGA